MTTVACNREEMAADSLVTVNDIRISRRAKIHRVNGALIGCAGRTGDTVAFREWYGQGGDGEKPDLNSNFAALVLTEEGIHWYDATCYVVPIDDDICALGSGGDLARGAMAAGSSPKEAVEVAVRYDVGSGLPVIVERLREGA